MDDPTSPVCYEIRVRGLLGETLLGAFPDLRAEQHGTETVLTGALPDQAALYGVLGFLAAEAAGLPGAPCDIADLDIEVPEEELGLVPPASDLDRLQAAASAIAARPPPPRPDIRI